MTDHIKSEIKSWICVFIGTIVMCAGFVFFINPYNIVPGGVYGASIVLHNLFPSVQVGTFGYFFDVPLLLISMFLLGTKLGLKTLASALSTPIIMNLISWAVYPDSESLHQLDPTMLLGGRMDMSNNLMLAVVMGSVLIGFGCGFVVKNGATTGGTDIVGMILQKYAKIRFSRAIVLVDGMVVLFGLVVFTLMPSGKTDSLLLSFFSLISIWLIAQVISRTINGSKDDKLLFVISDKDLVMLHDYILKDLDRTATMIKAMGLYTKHDKEMLFIVVSYKEVQTLKHVVKSADPRAFVVVTDAYDIHGEGWKPLPNEDEVQPE